MIEIAEDEASDQLKSLIDRAINGEEIVITRRGTPVVRMQPTEPVHDVEAARAAIERLRDYARSHPVPGITREEIKSWIEEGRP